MAFVIGFDLDMTLVDPRPGVVATYSALSAETGVAIDGGLAASRLGPPLERELAIWFGDGAGLAALAEDYRRHFATLGVAGTTLLPGASESLRAVAALGGRSIVITSKSESLARSTLGRLDLLGLVDTVEGGLWAEAKGDALRRHGGQAYVGDHLGDIAAARSADAIAISVATGPITAGDLAAAGADVVLRDLTELPAWLHADRRFGGREVPA